MFSIVIPAHNEEKCIFKTVKNILDCFEKHNISNYKYDIVIVNDHSIDDTYKEIRLLSCYNNVYCVENMKPPGYGYAVRSGIESSLELNEKGAICIAMGDASEDPEDIVKYYYKMEEGAECVFGSRFIKDSNVVNYPKYKLFINRLANWFIQLLFGIKYNDITNAFKCYDRKVLRGIKPYLSPHFNLTVELPLKAIVRGYNYTVIPISWYNRKEGKSKLQLKEMGSRYLFIVLYALIEKWLTKRDYYRNCEN
jgi:dolichol-phosphate mannosyltransferase